MNDLIIHPEYANLKDTIEKLKINLTEKIAKKDYLVFHECKTIETNYMLQLGYLEYKIFEIKLNIRKIRREIHLIQKQINLQKEVDLIFIRKQIEVEFEKQILELKEKSAKLNIALKQNDLKLLSDEESKEIKTIYKDLILKLHPDLNENIGEKEKDLFFQVMDAYEDGNLEKLKVLKILASDIMDISNIDGTDENIMDKLKEQVYTLEINLGIIDKEMDEIKRSYPYNKKDLINDENKLKKNKESLEQEIKENIELQNNYKKKLENLLKSIEKY